MIAPRSRVIIGVLSACAIGALSFLGLGAMGKFSSHNSGAADTAMAAGALSNIFGGKSDADARAPYENATFSIRVVPSELEWGSGDRGFRFTYCPLLSVGYAKVRQWGPAGCRR